MRRKKTRILPQISTASLPDIIFMLLFFFMVVTVMRQDSPLIPEVLPSTTYANKLSAADDQLVIRVGDDPQYVQIGKYLVDKDDIDRILLQMTSNLTASDREEIDVLLYADQSSHMAIVNAVKLALRKQEIYHLNYITRPVQQQI